MPLQECVEDILKNRRYIGLQGFEFSIVEWIMRDQNLGLEEALLLFHNSETFDRLCEKRTDLYIESPAYVYDLLKEGIHRGTFNGLTE